MATDYDTGYADGFTGRPYVGASRRYAAGYGTGKTDARSAAHEAAVAAAPTVPEAFRDAPRAAGNGARFAFPRPQEGRDEVDNTELPTGTVF